MLDAFIIDEIKRREVEERDGARRPTLEIPVPEDEPMSEGDGGSGRDEDDDGKEKPDRGVVTIDV